MKKIILALAVIFTVSTAIAQTKQRPVKQKQTPEQRAQKSTDHLDQIVTLTADQKTQVYNLALARAQKVDGIRAKYKGQPDQKETAKSEIKAAHKEYRQAVKPLLTAEQIEKLKAHHKANHPKGPKGGKHPKTTSEPAGNTDNVDDMIPSGDDGE